jgi:hypothetical protein
MCVLTDLPLSAIPMHRLASPSLVIELLDIVISTVTKTILGGRRDSSRETRVAMLVSASLRNVSTHSCCAASIGAIRGEHIRIHPGLPPLRYAATAQQISGSPRTPMSSVFFQGGSGLHIRAMQMRNRPLNPRTLGHEPRQRVSAPSPCKPSPAKRLSAGVQPAHPADCRAGR